MFLKTLTLWKTELWVSSPIPSDGEAVCVPLFPWLQPFLCPIQAIAMAEQGDEFESFIWAQLQF